MTRSVRRAAPLLALCAALGALALARPAARAADAPHAPDVLGFTMKRLDGAEQALSSYRGEVVLIVNTASKCGYTPQYEGLEALYRQYRPRGFVVLGFPANDFKQQEPGSDAQIAEFCRATYDVQFPMFSKIHVTGDEMHPLYRALTSLPPPIGGPVQWNFQKYLLDRHGQVVAKYPPNLDPRSRILIARIEELLAQPR